jgi:hypothetical protein
MRHLSEGGVADGVGERMILVLGLGGDGGADDDGAGIGEVCACVEVAEEMKILEDRLNLIN